MKKFFSSLLIGIILTLTTFAQAADQVNVIGYTPFAYEKTTVLSTAASGLNTTYSTTAGAVFITVETKNIRYKISGTDPTSTDGHLVEITAYQNLWFNDPASIRQFKAIGIGGNSTLHTTYYRRN